MEKVNLEDELKKFSAEARELVLTAPLTIAAVGRLVYPEEESSRHIPV